MKLILNYVYPKNGEVVVLNSMNQEDRYNLVWLDHMVRTNPDVIFFYTIATTDIWLYSVPDCNNPGPDCTLHNGRCD